MYKKHILVVFLLYLFMYIPSADSAISSAMTECIDIAGSHSKVFLKYIDYLKTATITIGNIREAKGENITLDCNKKEVKIYYPQNISVFYVWKNKQISAKIQIEGSPYLKPITLSFSTPVEILASAYKFYGLAEYYNQIQAIKLPTNNDISYIEPSGENLSATDKTWFGWKGRYKVFLFSSTEYKVHLMNSRFNLQWESNNLHEFQLYIGKVNPFAKKDRSHLDISAVRYSHLWPWLNAICRLVEQTLINIHKLFLNSWGLSIILFAVLIKILFIPVSLMTSRFQKEVSGHQAILEPKINDIKLKYDGEEAHNRIMSEYKSQGISPFYTLKPLLGTFIQIPVLIAIFSVLGEMPQLDGGSFLWIDNFIYPDEIGNLPIEITLLGDKISLLPIIMTIVSIVATLLYDDPYATKKELLRQKRNLYFMALAFFVLFYPFPAALVLYWTVANLLHLVQQKVVKI